MNPNANLAEQERTLRDIMRARTLTHMHEAIDELMGLREDMHDWLTRGGSEPNWAKAPLAREYYLPKVTITYPRLPDRERKPDQTGTTYGAAVLRSVRATETTATLSTEQIELIDHEYPLAV
jgi:hypothetical protein